MRTAAGEATSMSPQCRSSTPWRYARAAVPEESVCTVLPLLYYILIASLPAFTSVLAIHRGLSLLLQGDEWTARGTLTYTGPKLVTTKSKRLVSVQIEQSKFSSDDLHKLQKLVDEGRPYRIRIQVLKYPLSCCEY